jgi:hypothetical protein
MYLATYQFRVELTQDATIPPYLGSVFRHSFEHAFREISHVEPPKPPLDAFFKKHNPYFHLFDMDFRKTRIRDEKQKNIDIPKPFVIETPFATEPYEKRKGEELIFNVILFGSAISHIPLFLLAIAQAGRDGLADGTITYELKDARVVDAFEDTNIEFYKAKIGKIHHEPRLLPFDKVAAGFRTEEFKNLNRVSIEFLTPYRVKRTQKALESPDFFLIARSLLRRLMSLSRFHCDDRISLDYKHLMELASQVKLVENKIEWYDWGKYSPKNESKSQIGGLFGKVTYEGPLAEFLPYLIYGQLVHIGKNTAYGLGKYHLDFELPEG